MEPLYCWFPFVEGSQVLSRLRREGERERERKEGKGKERASAWRMKGEQYGGMSMDIRKGRRGEGERVRDRESQ